MKKLNKMILTLGTVATVVAPVAAVISCGSSKKIENVKQSKLTPSKETSTQKVVDGKGGTSAQEKLAEEKTGTPAVVSQDNPLNEATDILKSFVKYEDMSIEKKKVFDTKIKGATVSELHDFLAQAQLGEYKRLYKAYTETYDWYKLQLATLSKKITGIKAKVEALSKLATPANPAQFLLKNLITKGGAKLNTLLDETTDLFKFVDDKANDINEMDDKSFDALKDPQAELNHVTNVMRSLETSKNELMSSFVLKVSQFIKTEITGDFITQTLDTIVNKIDFKQNFDQLSNLISGLLPSSGPLALVKTGISMGLSMLGPKVQAMTDEQVANLKNKILSIIDAIDLDKMLDKIIARKGMIVPGLLKGKDGTSLLINRAVTISNLEELLVGNVLSWNMKDYQGNKIQSNGGIGIAQYFGMLLQPAAKPYFADESLKDTYDKSIAELEKDFPAIEGISPALRPLFYPVLLMIFSDYDGGKVKSAFSQLDLNIKDDKAAAFAETIKGAFDTILGFDLSKIKGMLKPGFGIKGFAIIGGMLSNGKLPSFLSNIIKPVFESLGTDANVAAKKIENIVNELIDLVEQIKSQAKTILDNISPTADTGKYLKITKSEDLYSNMRQGLIDFLSIDLSKMNVGDEIKSLPGFIDGTLLQNLVQGLTNILKTKFKDTVGQYFSGTNLEARVDDMKAPFGLAHPIGASNSEVWSLPQSSTLSVNQVEWILKNYKLFDLSTGKIEEGKDAKLPERNIEAESVKGFIQGHWSKITPNQNAMVLKAMAAGEWDYNKGEIVPSSKLKLPASVIETKANVGTESASTIYTRH